MAGLGLAATPLWRAPYSRLGRRMFFQIWRALFSFRSRYLDGLLSCSPSLYELLASNVLSIIPLSGNVERFRYTSSFHENAPARPLMRGSHTAPHKYLCRRRRYVSEAPTMGVLRYLKCAGDHASMSTPRFHYLDSAERVTPYPHLVRRLLLLGISVCGPF